MRAAVFLAASDSLRQATGEIAAIENRTGGALGRDMVGHAPACRRAAM